MPKPVKATRRYDSPHRREQAAATRRQILEAAETLFLDRGYAATSVAAIAAEGGVALKTVYVAFETKSGLLRALWHLRLRGDEVEAPVGERAWYREVIEEPDPERKLRLNVKNSRAVKERAGALMEVIRDAAPSDPEVATLWSGIESDFYENQLAIVKSLEKGALRDDLDARTAGDLLWTLNHPSVYSLLIGRGWSPEGYEEWLVDALRWQLLKPESG